MAIPGIEGGSKRSATTRRPRCSRCGACCLKQGSGFTMTPADFQRWKAQQREDILRYIPFQHSGSLDHDVWIEWADPDTRESLSCCPFLQRPGRRTCACAINETKPDICRGFWCRWAHRSGPKGQPFRPAAAS